MNELNELVFTLELNAEGVANSVEDDLFLMVDTNLRELAEGHDDMVGAAVTLRQPGEGQSTTYLFEATVVVYIKPENIAATAKDPDSVTAVRQALAAVEKQVRKSRDKKGKPWEQPQQGPVDQEIAEIVAAEEKMEAELNEE